MEQEFSKEATSSDFRYRRQKPINQSIDPAFPGGSQSRRVNPLGIENAPTKPPAFTKNGLPRNLFNSTPSPNSRYHTSSSVTSSAFSPWQPSRTYPSTPSTTTSTPRDLDLYASVLLKDRCLQPIVGKAYILSIFGTSICVLGWARLMDIYTRSSWFLQIERIGSINDRGSSACGA
jgi:hypothetical protein